MIGGGGSLAAAEREALDGLRGLAALIVVASHASNLGLHLVPGWSLAGIGKSGVYLFFVLSAFLLTWQWLRAPAQARRSAPWVAGYFLRRVSRIYPLYAAVLLTGWALAPRGLGVPMDGTAVWTHLSLREGRDIYWSVPVEFLYYLCIPPLAWTLSAAWPRALKVALMLGTLALALWWWPPAQAPLNTIVLGYYLPVFLAGSAAAWWWSARGIVAGEASPRRWGGRGLVLDLAFLVALLATVPSVVGLLGGDGVAADLTHRAFVPWGVFWALLLLGAIGGWLPGWRRALRWRALQRCGQWCFGLYLLHMPALLAARYLPGLAPTVKGWLALGLAIGLAAAAHRWIERPCIRWASRKWRGPQSVARAAPP